MRGSRGFDVGGLRRLPDLSDVIGKPQGQQEPAPAPEAGAGANPDGVAERFRPDEAYRWWPPPLALTFSMAIWTWLSISAAFAFTDSAFALAPRKSSVVMAPSASVMVMR